MAALHEKTIADNLLDAIQNSVNEIAEQEIKLAKERIERRVKQDVGAIAIRIAQWTEVKTLGNRLIIEVKMSDPSKE